MWSVSNHTSQFSYWSSSNHLLLFLIGLKPLSHELSQQFTVKFLGSTNVKEPRGELPFSPNHINLYDVSIGKGVVTTTIRKVLAARAMQNVMKTQDSIMMVTMEKLQ